MPLSPFVPLKAKPQEKPYKLFDGEGLYLLVNPTGSKLWRLKYRFGGKEKLLSIGEFPTITLAEARDARIAARKLLASGVDPSQQRKADKAAGAEASANTFGVIAEEYVAKLEEEGRAKRTLAKNRWLLLDVAKPLHTKPITEVTPADILAILKRVEKLGKRETAHRLRGTIGGVFRLAIATLRATTDPTYALRGALAKVQVEHRPAITDEAELGALMQSLDEYTGWPTLKAAITVMILTMTRPGETRLMRRPEIDFPRAIWRIPAARMKMRRPHEVPLSNQAISALQGIWEASTGDGFVFPSLRSQLKPLSDNAMNSVLRRLGYTQDEVTAHGFRSSASTILNERGFDPEVIEAALAHQDPNEQRRIYNRARKWRERVALMQAWADILDDLKNPRIVRKLT